MSSKPPWSTEGVPGQPGLHRETFSGAGEMVQRLRALPALPKVLSSIPSNHMAAHNHEMRSGALFWSAAYRQNIVYIINK